MGGVVEQLRAVKDEGELKRIRAAAIESPNRRDRPAKRSPAVCGRARVGHEATIGAGATILPDVQIGARAVVGAGALVREDVPASVRVAGVPAQRLS